MIYSGYTQRSANPSEDLFELDPASNSIVIVHPGVIRRQKMEEKRSYRRI